MVDKITTAEELQDEIRTLWAMTEESQPSRTKLAAALSELAEKVASGEDVTAGGGYGPQFAKLVQCVDGFSMGLKKLVQAQNTLRVIGDLVKNDPDVEQLEGLNKYAPAQHVELLEKALFNAEFAVKDLIEQYDQSNSAFLRMGLRG